MKYIKIATLAVASIMVLSLAACSTTGNDKGINDSIPPVTATTPPTLNNDDVEIPNPIKEHASLEDAETLTGITFNEAQKFINEYEATVTTIDNLIQIKFVDNGNEITIRKAISNSDISGIFTSYPDVLTVTKGDDVQVSLQGKDEIYSLATWNIDGTAYSVFVSNLEDDEITVDINTYIDLMFE